MTQKKIYDCITFFDENLLTNLRFEILKDVVDYFIVCESKFDHKRREKDINFSLINKDLKNKVKHLVINEPFPSNLNYWQIEEFQREKLLKATEEADPEDFIMYSDSDEIPNPDILKNINLKKKYGIFFHDCFNYKINLFNPYESPWEGTRVVKKKNLNSIDFMRQKILYKNLNYSFFRIDKEKNIQIFKNAGWHFNNLIPPESISLKLKTFAHKEYSGEEFSSLNIIKDKINKKIDLFNRGHTYKVVNLDNNFPKYILDNLEKFEDYIV